MWPRWNDKPLGFLAQINLEEVAAFDVENQLPKSGLLLFFYFSSDENWPYGEATQKKGWRVFHSATASLFRQVVPLASLNEYPFGCGMFSTGIRWTPSDFPHESLVTLTEQEYEAWSNYLDRIWFSQPQHQMFGNPKVVQNDARFDAAQKSGRGEQENWQLLLQIDSDNALDFTWGDAGALYFLTHGDDLAAHDFSQVWCIADCS